MRDNGCTDRSKVGSLKIFERVALLLRRLAGGHAGIELVANQWVSPNSTA
jgi:hypothetical protein